MLPPRPSTARLRRLFLKKVLLTFLLSLPVLVLLTAGQPDPRPLRTVPHVDLARYCGTWYEIASFPQSFQRNCVGTTATYTLLNNGQVKVYNRCFKGSAGGEVSDITGKARVVQGSGNARLKVQFFWPFSGKYWIIDLADDYSHAVVSHPSRKYLWILSRTPRMDEATYSGILERLREQELDVSQLKKTLQPLASENP